MKKSFLLVLAAAGVFAACTNGDADSRLNRLEQRVAALEANNGKQPVAISDQPATANQSTQLVSDQVVADGPKAKIEYQEAVHDFGTVKEGAVVTHTFKFTNTGDVPLIVQNATASCGCTVPSKPKDPIAPGQTGEIQVRFDSATRPGAQNKTITVTANTEPAITKLTIKGNVEPKAAAAASTEGPVRN